ncbi:MAG: MFS transporter [Verrucomicrobiaceae bacterium]|nr:MFS transporter [Verrucomicrobiaceae bacterium]
MKRSHVRHIVLAGLCAAAALAYFTRNGVAPAESTIRAELGLTKEESGMLMSAFFWPYALCQIPAALLARRIGTRWALALYGALWSLATAGLSIGNVMVMTASRAFMGVAQAGLVPVGTAAMARWFPRSAQASASGAFSGFMSVGSIVAAPLTAWLVVTCGWRWMFVWYAVPGLVWALWFALWYRNSPAEHPAANEAERQWIMQDGNGAALGTTALPWSLLARSPAMWCLCLQQFCRAAGYIFFASWFATYLQEARGVTILRSGWLTTLPLLADVTGCMAGGVLSDALLKHRGSARLARQGLSAAALLMCAGLIFAAWRAADPLMAVLVISAGMFCAAVANPCLAATVMRLGGPHVAAVSAVTNMCGNFGAASFPLAVPWLLAHAGGWNAVLGAFGALYIVGAVFWLLMKVERAMEE